MLVVVGTTTVDIFIAGLDRIPGLADDEFTSESLAFLDTPMRTTIGGNGANAAYVHAGLGAGTRLCSVIGTDALGDVVLQWLHERGVDTQAVRRDLCEATATTTIITDREMHRLAFHHPGGSHGYRPEHLPSPLVTHGDTLLLTSYHLLPGFRGQRAAALLASAKAAGARTALDVGPAIGNIAGIAEMAEILPHVDILLANRYELTRCMDEDDVEQAAAAALAMGAAAVVVKWGRHGASLRTSGKGTDVPGFTVHVRSTVGAGDAFDAGFLHATDAGMPVQEALRVANAVAALVVSSDAGILSAPSKSQVEAFLRRG